MGIVTKSQVVANWLRPKGLLIRAAVIGGSFACLCLLFAIARHYVDLDFLVSKELQLRDLLHRYPVRAFLTCFVVYVLVSLVPGLTGKSLVVAWLFGFWQGLVIVNLALTMAATISLLIGRYVLQEAVTHRWHSFVEATNRALERDGGLYVLLLRLLHAPFTIVNYALGATTIETRTFWWATQIGMLPGNVIFVYAGTQIPSIRQVANHGVWSLLTPGLVTAFVLLTVAPLLLRWLAIRLRRR